MYNTRNTMYKLKAYIRSFTEWGKTYTIKQKMNGELTCNCPSWIFFQDPVYENGTRKRSCKHIRAILNAKDPLEKMIFNSGKYVIDIDGEKWEIRKEEKHED